MFTVNVSKTALSAARAALSGILGLTLTSMVALASANAADLYRSETPGGYKDAPAYDGPAYGAQTWTGFYAGVNGGYGWNSGNGHLGVTGIDCDVGPATATGSTNLESSGGFGGGQIGYNWQGVIFGPRTVLGIEADLQGSGINGKATKTVTTPGDDEAFTPFAASAKSSLDWFGTVRGRLGYTFDRTLVYATGGFAFGGVKDRVSLSITDDATTTGSVRKSETATGFVVGGGVEYKVSPAWSIKGDYQFIDLGSEKLNVAVAGDPPGTASLNADHTYHTVRAGLNYHILPAYEPLK